jgi:hypothetical protein
MTALQLFLNPLRLMGLLSVILLASLKLGAQNGCIQGRVVDAANAPVPSVYVAAFGVSDLSNEEVETDGDGYFLLNDFLDPGQDYAVAASDRSLLGNASFSDVHLPGAVRTKAGPVGRCSDITLHHSARARLRLKVTNLLTGEPLESPQASFRFKGDLLWRSGINKDGELLVPPSSGLEIQLASAGYEHSELLQTSTPAPGKAREFAVELRPVETGCVTGTVADIHGTPVSRARIQISPDNQSNHQDYKMTDGDGRFRVDGVQPGRSYVVVYASDYPLSFNPRDGTVTDIDVASGPDCTEANIRLGPKAAKLLVDVIDAITQKPIEDAKGWLRADFADDGGSRMLAIAVPTPVRARTQYSLYVQANGYLLPQPVTVLPMQPDEAQEITVSLRPDPSQSAR